LIYGYGRFKGAKFVARRRMIDPHFWESGDIKKLDFFTRLFFIGMFSMADDEGRGTGGASYLKSIIFPHDEIPPAKIKKSLEAIKNDTSIIFYAVDCQEYYQFTNWKKWQRVDKPKESFLPPPPYIYRKESEKESDKESEKESTIDSCLKERKVKERNLKEENSGSFALPSLEEVQAYCKERQNGLNAQTFIDFYAGKGWMVGKNKMKDWKACIRTWEQREVKPNAKRSGNIEPEPTTKYGTYL
jgi:hypothetical protein